jgi:hypothetical protein
LDDRGHATRFVGFNVDQLGGRAHRHRPQLQVGEPILLVIRRSREKPQHGPFRRREANSSVATTSL